MIEVLVRSLALTFAVVFVSHAVSYGTLAHLGYGYSIFVASTNTLVSVLTALPFSLFVLARQRSMRMRYEALSRAYDKLTETSSRDGLTGLMARDRFFEEMASIRSNRKTGALLIVDADHFKDINDRFGHLAGDRALKLLAGAIACSVRERDVVGRIGGEEFAVYLPETGLDDAVEIAERLRRAVEAVRFEPAPHLRHPLTVSIGIAKAVASNARSAVFAAADTCLYQAKENGRNTVVCEDQSPGYGNIARLHERRSFRQALRS